MRDSLGIVAPLSLTAYGVGGDTISGVPTFFVVLDTGAHLVGPLLVGDSVGQTVHVIGSVESVQTRPAAVLVTASPDTLVATDSVLHRRTYSIPPDSVSTATLNVTVLHRSGAVSTGVAAVIVTYAVERAPAGDNNQGPAFLLLNERLQSDRDTTAITGVATLTGRFRPLAKQTFVVDTAEVSATASYRGSTIGRVLFTLIFSNQTAAP